MTVSNSKQIQEEFIEARNHWELEKLYIDLASAKGKALTPVEKKFLRGLLCGLSPAEIASTVYKSGSSNTVRVYLSNGLYKYIEDMLSNQTGYSVKVKNWSRVTRLLEKAGYKKSGSKAAGEHFVTPISSSQLDEKEITDVSFFSERETELAQVQKWMFQENCRLVVISGPAGIGKTAFAIKLVQAIQENFDSVIWRSLSFAPPAEKLLSELIQFFSSNSTQVNAKVGISHLLDCVRASRCLIILDDLDAILGNKYSDQHQDFLVSANNAFYSLPHISYRQEYEDYEELIRCILEAQNQSFLLLITREKPRQIAEWEGKNLPVRCLKLTGLSQEGIRKILADAGLMELDEETGQKITKFYAGNPLFVKLVAQSIQEFFDCEIQTFLEQEMLVVGDIKTILDQQFQRLSNLEKQIISCLAINYEPTSLAAIKSSMLPHIPPQLILKGIELLQKRSLVARQGAGFTCDLVWREYIVEKLIEENWKFSVEKANFFLSIAHAFLEKQLKNYLRASRLNVKNLR